MRIDGRKNDEKAIFGVNYSNGVKTNRDVWVYSSSRKQLAEHIEQTIGFYNSELARYQRAKLALPIVERKDFSPKDFVTYNLKKIAWTFNLFVYANKGKELTTHKQSFYVSTYRPFFKQFMYFDRELNERVYQLPKFFPTPSIKNPTICVSGIGAKEFSCLMVNSIADLQILFNGQCFPRYVYRKIEPEISDKNQGVLNLVESRTNLTSRLDKEYGYIKEEAITNVGVDHFQEAYPNEPITKEDLFYYIYGILHSRDYRMKYANNLSKELPRIPRVATYEQFQAFAEAGRKLADLHVNFEKQQVFQNVKIIKKPGASYRVTQMKWGKIPGKTGNAAKDKTVLHYNDDITIENIPLEAQEYVVNKKSALDWVVERCCVSEDKASGIVNDFNLYGEEQGISKYPFELFLRMITVSLKTVNIVKNLPPLEIHVLDKE